MIELYGKEFYTNYLYRPEKLIRGIMSIPGYDFGGGQGNDLAIVWKSDDFRIVIAKVQGYTGWSSRGETDYYATSYKLLERHLLYPKQAERDMYGCQGYRYVLLAEFKFGRFWQRGTVALARLAIKLDEGKVTDIKAELAKVREVVNG